MVVILLLIAACADDSCVQMCQLASRAYADCLTDADITWEDAGYSDSADFGLTCSTWVWEQELMDAEARTRRNTNEICAARASALQQQPDCDTWRSWDWNEPGRVP